MWVRRKSRCAGEQQRIAVLVCAGDYLRAERRAGATAIFNDDRLSEVRAELLDQNTPRRYRSFHPAEMERRE